MPAVDEFREMLPRDDNPGHKLLLCWVYWDPDTGGEATSEITVIRLRIESNELRHEMSVAPQHSARQDGDGTRPVKSTRPISVPLFGKMRQIKLSVLLPVVFAANVVVATVAWYIVGLLMR